MDQRNYTMLSGKVNGTPRFDHECCGEKFLMITLAVERQSGNVDHLPVMCSERLFAEELSKKEITVVGQIRTYDKVAKDGRIHHLTVAFAKCLFPSEGEDSNYVRLVGRICKLPSYRVTPLGREICDICLAVNREYGKSDYIHCICWGRTARYVSHLQVGNRLMVEGRFQSRPYTKTVVTEEGQYEVERIAYEISCARVSEVTED